jgi:hypothetical protein
LQLNVGVSQLPSLYRRLSAKGALMSSGTIGGKLGASIARGWEAKHGKRGAWGRTGAWSVVGGIGLLGMEMLGAGSAGGERNQIMFIALGLVFLALGLGMLIAALFMKPDRLEAPPQAKRSRRRR